MLKQFFNDLYRDCEEGSFTVTTLPDGRNYHFSVAEIDKAAETVTSLGQKCNTYYNLALRVPGLDEWTRGKEEQIRTVVCMFADIDIKGPAHKQEALPGGSEEVEAFLSSLGLPASYVIGSGNGMHAIWLLEEPFHIRTPEDLENIKSISQGFGAHIIREGMKRGWTLDNVQDITRMLRAPGTLNFKTDPPKPCTVITRSGLRYPISSFEPYKSPGKEKSYTPLYPDDDRIGPAERMRGQCAFIDHCIDEAPFLPEPWWHAFLSIVALTEDGDQKCHEWSEDHGNYTYEETESYRERAVREQKPCSCEFISRALGFNCPQGGCQNCGRTVKGPIAFSFYTKEEQLERLLSEKLDRFLPYVFR